MHVLRHLLEHRAHGEHALVLDLVDLGGSALVVGILENGLKHVHEEGLIDPRAELFHREV